MCSMLDYERTELTGTGLVAMLFCSSFFPTKGSGFEPGGGLCISMALYPPHDIASRLHLCGARAWRFLSTTLLQIADQPESRGRIGLNTNRRVRQVRRLLLHNDSANFSEDVSPAVPGASCSFPAVWKIYGTPRSLSTVTTSAAPAKSKSITASSKATFLDIRSARDKLYAVTTLPPYRTIRSCSETALSRSACKIKTVRLERLEFTISLPRHLAAIHPGRGRPYDEVFPRNSSLRNEPAASEITYYAPPRTNTSVLSGPSDDRRGSIAVLLQSGRARVRP